MPIWKISCRLISGESLTVQNGLEAGTDYEFRVRAVNKQGEQMSQWSASAFVTTLERVDNYNQRDLYVVDSQGLQDYARWDRLDASATEMRLVGLDIDNWNGQTLDVSDCTALKGLSISNVTQLTSIKLSGCIKLGVLEIDNMQQSKVDIFGSTALDLFDIYIYDSQVTTLNLSGFTSCLNTFNLSAHDSQLTTLNLSGFTSLEYLNLSAYDSQLATLNFSGFAELRALSIECTSLTSLDVSGLLTLEYLSVINSQLTTLDLTDTPFANFQNAIRTEYTEDTHDYYEYAFASPERYLYLYVDKTVTLINNSTIRFIVTSMAPGTASVSWTGQAPAFLADCDLQYRIQGTDKWIRWYFEGVPTSPIELTGLKAGTYEFQWANTAGQTVIMMNTVTVAVAQETEAVDLVKPTVTVVKTNATPSSITLMLPTILADNDHYIITCITKGANIAPVSTTGGTVTIYGLKAGRLHC